MAQNRLVISAVVAAIAAFGFFHFVLSPKHKEADKLSAQVSEAQGELAQAQTTITSNKNAQEGFKEAYSDVVRLGKAVPGDDDVRSLVVQLDQAAKSAGIHFQSIEVGGSSGASASGAASTVQLPPGATIGPAGFPVMPFTFTFKGQFFRLGDFFHRLDAFVDANNKKLSITGRLLTVDGLQLAPDTTGFPNIKAEVQATSYLVSPVEGATGGATPTGPTDATAATADTTTASTTTPASTTTESGVSR